MGNDLERASTLTTAVLDDLDGFAAQWDSAHKEEDGSVSRRIKWRRKLRVACEIWYFEDMGRSLRQKTAHTRNLSERGIGLIAKCVVLEGIPIEVRITAANRPPMHLAGIVAFCRHAKRGFHEIGVELRTCQDAPVFAEDRAAAVRSLPWLQEALVAVRRGEKLPKRQTESADSEAEPSRSEAESSQSHAEPRPSHEEVRARA